MPTVSRSLKSLFREFDATDIALILIAIGLICISWPTSAIVILIVCFCSPIWMMWRLVDQAVKKMT